PKNYVAFIANSGFGPAQPGAKVPASVQEIQQYMPPSGFTPSWDQVFHPNRNAGPLAAIPFAYSSIAPLGTESDMSALAQQMQNDWKAGLH
ncbi:MAG TPA: hypothetical protein VN108_01450, partial [Marmoricola sp.]|nr:hypothetical protein [Marmoricola sp.]